MRQQDGDLNPDLVKLTQPYSSFEYLEQDAAALEESNSRYRSCHHRLMHWQSIQVEAKALEVERTCTVESFF